MKKKFHLDTYVSVFLQRNQDSYVCYSQIAKAALLSLLQITRERPSDFVFKNAENDVEMLQQ